jgi:hypothetical protein
MRRALRQLFPTFAELETHEALLLPFAFALLFAPLSELLRTVFFSAPGE